MPDIDNQADDDKQSNLVQLRTPGASRSSRSKTIALQKARSIAPMKSSSRRESSSVTPITTHKLEEIQDDWAPVLQKVANKDRGAYAKLFAHFAPRIKSFALMMRSNLTNQEMADELVQEVMLKVWLKASSFNPAKASVNTWIFTIARNARIDYIRKKMRGDVNVDNDAIWELEDEHEPVSSLEELRIQKHMHSAIDELPSEQADALKQIYLEGKSHAEVAEQSQLPLGTVKSRVRLAMVKLRNRFSQSDELSGYLDFDDGPE